jgi:hypothetical protein
MPVDNGTESAAPLAAPSCIMIPGVERAVSGGVVRQWAFGIE